MAHATVSRCLVRRGMSRGRGRRARRCGGLSGRAPAICCRWTPSAWRASAAGPRGHRRPPSHRRREAQARGLGVLSLDHRRPQPLGLHRDPSPTRRPPTVTAFVERALEFFADHGITARRLQTDNAWTYIHNRDAARAAARARDPAPHDPAAHAQAQRQGRALPADPRPRMGLRTALPQLRRPRGSAARSGSSITTPPATTARSRNRPPITRVRDQPRHNS